ncbi:MAG TPA: hypothetical protein VK469_15355 [Candidatus Kapabacteria bacterium]|nr:hypothetical protein [Candidatus Kapabacteria bacterium]
MDTISYGFGVKKMGKKSCVFFIFSLSLILVLTMACLWGCPNGEKKIEKDQAWEIVKKNILKDNPGESIVYLAKDLLDAGQEVKSWQQVYVVPKEFKKAWFFFVDDQPDANWGHQCRYIFVDMETGKYHIINALTPPDTMAGMTQIFPPAET